MNVQWTFDSLRGGFPYEKRRLIKQTGCSDGDKHLVIIVTYSHVPPLEWCGCDRTRDLWTNREIRLGYSLGWQSRRGSSDGKVLMLEGYLQITYHQNVAVAVYF